MPHVPERGVIDHGYAGCDAALSGVGFDHRDADVVEIVSDLGLGEDLLVLDLALLYYVADQFGGYHSLVIVREDNAVRALDQLL